MWGVSTVVTILLVFSPVNVASFGTINTLGLLNQHGEHERITRAALECTNGTSDGSCFENESIDQLAGDDFSFGAVGDPDRLRGTEFGEPAEAHCDDADFLDTADYPRTRKDATLALFGCIRHLRKRVSEGTAAAVTILNSNGEILRNRVSLNHDCKFMDDSSDNAKCRSIQGFGRALHGIQDFYSHSNWADEATKPYGPLNPPGLRLSYVAPFLDLRAVRGISAHIPLNLSTGCYSLPTNFGLTINDRTPGIENCLGRITHDTLNKDKGIIDSETGTTTDVYTERGRFAGNFDAAVQLAISDTRRQWKYFQYELHELYGSTNANRIICALTRDQPVSSCQGRKLAIIIGSSGSEEDEYASSLRTKAATSFVNQLFSTKDTGIDTRADLVTAIDFHRPDRVVCPMADPAHVNFSGLNCVSQESDSSGTTDSSAVDNGTYIAHGIRAAIEELMKNEQHFSTRDRSGIIVLTDEMDSDNLPLLSQIVNARILGIRVSLGILSSSTDSYSIFSSMSGSLLFPNVNSFISQQSDRQSFENQQIDIQTAILKTGGVFGTIMFAEAQQSFVDIVLGHGTTKMDNNPAFIFLKPGVVTTNLITNSMTKSFIYEARATEMLTFLVKPITTQIFLKATLHDIRGNWDVATTFNDFKDSQYATIDFFVAHNMELELLVEANVYNGSSISADGSVEGLFSVQVLTSAAFDDTMQLEDLASSATGTTEMVDDTIPILLSQLTETADCHASVDTEAYDSYIASAARATTAARVKYAAVFPSFIRAVNDEGKKGVTQLVLGFIALPVVAWAVLT